MVQWSILHVEMYLIQPYVIQRLTEGLWLYKFSTETPVSSTNKTDCHDITEILLKVAINTIKQTNKLNITFCELVSTCISPQHIALHIIIYVFVSIVTINIVSLLSK